jgi:hypothetical protein
LKINLKKPQVTILRKFSAVNIGIVEYPLNADSMEHLINQAVQALFESKREYYSVLEKLKLLSQLIESKNG